jgi:deazaflavin-dependent oxidoreductase (nitroreductase family)
MARTYRSTAFLRLRDRLMTFMLRKGVGPPGIYLLTIPGRKSGVPQVTPVAPLLDGESRWLVAVYGPGGWVLNARAAGRVTLSRGQAADIYTVTELGPTEAAPVLKRYLTEHPRTVGAYFDVSKDAAVDDFAAEAPRHPVFRLQAAGASGS